MPSRRVSIPSSPASAAAPLKLANALDRSEPLGVLLGRLQQAKDHFAAVAPLLPPGLRADVRAGPVEGDSWTLLATHNPAAAKLRHLLPTLLLHLREQGWQGTSIKVRVQPRTPAA